MPKGSGRVILDDLIISKFKKNVKSFNDALFPLPLRPIIPCLAGRQAKNSPFFDFKRNVIQRLKFLVSLICQAQG